MRIIALILLFFATSAWAQDAECGYDTDHNGTITLCTNGDNDRDGFTTAQGDCDDTDQKCFPGVGCVSTCGANSARNCAANGTGWLDACSAANAWQPEGTLTVRYIKPGGNNSLSGASDANAWADQRNFTSYYNVPDRPATYEDPVQGRSYVFRGGTYTYSYVYDTGGFGLFLRNKNGTSTQRIIVTAYPGEDVNFQPSTVTYPAVSVLSSNYVDLLLLNLHDVRGIGYQTGNNGGLNINGSTGNRVLGTTVYNIDGNQSGNLACIHTNGTIDAQINNNFLWDCYDRPTDLGGNSENTGGGTCTGGGSCTNGTTENNSAFVDFNSNNLKFRRNKILNTATATSNCIKKKHTNTTVTTIPEIDWNYCYRATPALESYVIGTSGSVNLHHNKTAGTPAGNYALSTRDFGGPTNFSLDSLVEYNDFDAGVNYRPSKDSAGGATTFGNFVTRFNLIKDARTTGNMISFCPDGTEAYYTDLVTGAKTTWNNNCYDLPNVATFPYDVFGNPSGSTTYCGIGTAGASGAAGTTFVGWAETGASETSFSYDSNGVPTACTTRGRFVGFSGGGSASARKGQRNGSGRKGLK